MKKIATFGAAAALLASAGVASAGVMDSDPANDTQAGADIVTVDMDGNASFGAELVSGQVGDVDWFNIDVPANSFLTIVIIPLDIPLLSPDTILGLFDAGGSQLDFNDDFGSGFGSALTYENIGAQTLSFAVSGFGDAADFNGSHDESGSYIVKVSINPIPTPGAIALAGLAGLAAVRRRR